MPSLWLRRMRAAGVSVGLLAAALLAISVVPASGAEVIYKSKDGAGNITYSDRVPPDAKNVTAIRVLPTAGVLGIRPTPEAGAQPVSAGQSPPAVAATNGASTQGGPEHSGLQGSSSSQAGGGGGGGGAGGAGRPALAAGDQTTPQSLPIPASSATVVGAQSPQLPPQGPSALRLTPPTSADGGPPRFQVGAGVHFGPGYGSLAWVSRKFKNMQISGVRQDVLWEWVEPLKGTWR
jgi:hypothetical protein